MKHGWWILLGASLALGPTLGATDAQAQPGIKAPNKKKGDKGRFAKVRQRLLKGQMGLDDAKADKVEAILRDHVKQRRASQQAMKQAQRELRRMLRADSSDQAAYAKALADLEKAHDDVEKLRKKHFTELRAVLTPKQQAQLIHAMHKIKRHLSRAKRKAGRRRGPRPWRRPKGPPQNPGF